MIIVNEPLLKTYRTPGLCGYCRDWCSVREPHHLWAKGMGGGGRLDVSCNLIALGSAFACQCHTAVHAGNITRSDMLLMVSAREGCLQRDIEELVYLLRRLPKGLGPAEIAAAIDGLSVGARLLGRRTIAEAGILAA